MLKNFETNNYTTERFACDICMLPILSSNVKHHTICHLTFKKKDVIIYENENTVNKFKLSFRMAPGYTMKFYFCWNNGRDIIGTYCSQNWNFNYKLFGGNSDIPSSITIYNYVKLYTSILTKTEMNNTNLRAKIFIPGKKIKDLGTF